RPLISLPVETLSRWLIRHAFPPDAALGGQGHVREDGVLSQRNHGVGIRLRRGTRRHSKETRLGIDSVQATVSIWLDPGDVIADGPNLPALKAGGRNEHGEVSLAARAGERSGDIGLFTLRIFNADYQHVLSHPAFVASDVRRDTKRKALLAKQSVAAVAGTVRPNLARLGEVNDVLFFVAGPGHIALARSEWSPDGMHAGHDALVVLVDLCVN